NESAEGMPHNDGWPVQVTDDLFVVLDNLGQSQPGDWRGVAAKLLDVALHARPASRDHAESATRVAVHPMLPAQRGHPETMNQHDGVWRGGGRSGRHQFLTGNGLR